VQTLSFDVNGMTCGGRTGSVQRALGKLDGVSQVPPARPGVPDCIAGKRLARR
jgi:copper chaperone